MMIHSRRDQTTSESYNWSGYAVTGSKGSVTDVKASWIVPAVTCGGTPEGYSAIWTGIDGWTSNTVEQIGTDSDCVSPANTPNTPTYYAWFEFYPQDAFYIGDPDRQFHGYEVSPGDTMSADVKLSATTGPGPGGRGGRIAGPAGHGGGPTFTLTISNQTKGWSFTTTSSVPGAQESSAEWIMETPFGCPTSSGYCPLSNFGTADYGDHYTFVPNTSFATIGSSTGPIGSFANKQVQQAVMVDYPSGTTTMAQPSSLLPDKASFWVSWLNVGP
jgi:hypothetical protein